MTFQALAVLLLGLLAVNAAPIHNADEQNGADSTCGLAKVPISRIVGGSTAQKGQYPWIASLRFKRLNQDYHTCGCSILDDRWILVAGHCFANSDKPDNYIVRVGTYNQTAGKNEPEAVEMEVEKIIKHANFTMTVKIQNDIALMKLKKSIDFSSKYINTVCLPDNKNYPTDDKVLTVAGWGDTVTGDSKHIPQLLKQTDLVAQPDSKCKSSWGSFMWQDGQMLCAMAPNTSPCVGDSGGPLMLRSESTGQMVQVGVVSFGESSCAGPRPPVFTRVSNYLDWIEAQKKANN